MNSRKNTLRRITKETNVEVTIDLDGCRQLDVNTGLGFFDHMICAMAFHARWDLALEAQGDLEVDDHHTIEDCGLALGQALQQAWGEKSGLTRFGSQYAPLDDSLARCVVDLSGRPFSCVNLDLQRDCIGQVACENLTHFFESLAISGGFTLHLDLIRGTNDHHRAEAAFKACGLTLWMATRRMEDPRLASQIPSTKGAL